MEQVGFLIGRRILYAIPTLLAISLIAFALSKAAPGDPVQQILHRTGEESLGNMDQEEKSYRQTARILGLDQPAFYISLLPLAYPDTLFRMVHPVRRSVLKKLCARYGNPSAGVAYYQLVEKVLHEAADSSPAALQAAKE